MKAILADVVVSLMGFMFGVASLYLPRKTIDGVVILITGIMFAMAVYLKAKL